LLTDDNQIRELWIDGTPADVLHAHEPIIFGPRSVVEEPVVKEIFEEIGVVENVVGRR
jgi:hypothetical protein